jgi:hypothetical protein
VRADVQPNDDSAHQGSVEPRRRAHA